MDAVPYIAPGRREPEGHWLRRAATALLVERRLPYRIAVRTDKVLARLGFRTKIISANGCRFQVRRLTQDELFVENIFVREEYNPPGYEIGETDTVIDIGGNIGSFALLAAQKAKRGRVFSFEPVRENFTHLTNNLARNRINNVVPLSDC